MSLAPVWFDPADVSGIITPFMVLYALHDAMAKPMPGSMQAPCLAEAWSVGEDQLSHEFVGDLGVGAGVNPSDNCGAEKSFEARYARPVQPVSVSTWESA